MVVIAVGGESSGDTKAEEDVGGEVHVWGRPLVLLSFVCTI